MDLEEITFVRSPAKHGWISKKDDVTGEVVKEQTYVFTIPQTYIRSGIIDTSKRYKVYTFLKI